MDLAEIRKKAKATQAPTPRREKKEINAKVPAPEPPAKNGKVGEQGKKEEKRVAAPAPAAVDPLEELFNVPLEIATATEESYHQALDKSTEEKGNLRQLLTFSLGDEEYALDIEAIREIIKPREVTDLPRVPDFILGLISLRGIIIPIYDLSQRMRLGKSVITPASRVIVCQCEDRVFGLLVDSISQVMRLPNQNIEPPPAVLSGIDRDLVEGVGRYQGKMMILLHLPCVADTELL